MKMYKKCAAEQYSFLVNDATLASDNPLRFRKKILTYNKIMIIDDQIRDEKLQYDFNREAAKISALLSGKIDKYEYLTSKQILPSNQQQIIEQANHSPLGKAFEKQIKAIQVQGHVKTIERYDYDDKDSPLIVKQKEIFNELADKRRKGKTELDKKS